MSETTLDAAWKRAEAALPEYWRIRSLIDIGKSGTFWWEVVATDSRRIRAASGPTPIAALTAFADGWGVPSMTPAYQGGEK